MVNAVNTALLVMANAAAKAGMGMRNLALSTGLSVSELQRWQHAAQVNGLSADSLNDSLLTLQNTRAQFMLGEPENVGAWQLLGVNPTEDPFKVLAALRERFKNISDPTVLRNLLGRVGLEGMLPLIRASNEEFERFQRNLVQTRQQIDTLARLNSAWEDLKFSLASVRNQFVAALAPAFTEIAKALTWVTGKIAAFTQWLNSGGLVATWVRRVLSMLVLALLALGAVLTLVATALGVAALVIKTVGLAALVATPEVLALAGAFFTALGPIALCTAAILGALLVWDDLMNYLKGGKSVIGSLPGWAKLFAGPYAGVFDLLGLVQKLIGVFPQIAAGVRSIGEAFKEVIKTPTAFVDLLLRLLLLWGRIKQGLSKSLGGKSQVPTLVKKAGMALSVIKHAITAKVFHGGVEAERAQQIATAPVNNSIVTTRSSASNNITVQVNGAQSPEATGRAVTRTLRDECGIALRQAPVPSR